jgi:hypothetical protein
MEQSSDHRRLRWIRLRADYWWRALRRGWPHVWRVAGVLALLVGGSVLALVVLVAGEPMLGALIFLLVVLLTLAEGTYRLSQEAPRTDEGISVKQLQDFAEAVRAGAFDRDPLRNDAGAERRTCAPGGHR